MTSWHVPSHLVEIFFRFLTFSIFKNVLEYQKDSKLLGWSVTTFSKLIKRGSKNRWFEKVTNSRFQAHLNDKSLKQTKSKTFLLRIKEQNELEFQTNYQPSLIIFNFFNFYK